MAVDQNVSVVLMLRGMGCSSVCRLVRQVQVRESQVDGLEVERWWSVRLEWRSGLVALGRLLLAGDQWAKEDENLVDGAEDNNASRSATADSEAKRAWGQWMRRRRGRRL
jgi:hypothetical protein